MSAARYRWLCPASTYTNVADVVVNGDRQFQGKVARLALCAVAVFPVRQHGPVDAERHQPLHLVGLGGEPSEARLLDEVVERQQPPHEHLGGRILAATVAYVGNAKRPIEGLAGEEDGARAAGKDGPLVLDGELLVDELADEHARRFAVRAAKETNTTAIG